MLMDTLWVFLAAILVFFMNLGFAAVESGFARSKNTVNILSKNFIVFAVSSLGFLLLGWGLMFGGNNPFVGTENLWILGKSDLSAYDATLTENVPFWGKFFFQLVFCGTAATIVSGAVAERVKCVVYCFFICTDSCNLSHCRPLGLGRRMACRSWFYGFCGRHCGSLGRRMGGACRGDCAWSSYRKIRKGWQTARNSRT